MNCPLCGCDYIRKSESRDSLWRTLLLHKAMRCYRCFHVFAAPLWAKPKARAGMRLQAPESEAAAVH